MCLGRIYHGRRDRGDGECGVLRAVGNDHDRGRDHFALRNRVSTDLSSRFGAPPAGVTFWVDTGGNSVGYASVLSGSGALAKMGQGALTLTGANTSLVESL